jgi:FkbM family methyltransferase
MLYQLQKILEKIKNLIKSFSYRFNRTVSLKIKNIYFKLYIRKKNIQGHSVYGFMSDNKHVYELAIITCLNNIVEKYKNIIFADIGSFVGFYAIYFSKLTNDKNKVFAIESNKLYCEDIKKSKDINNIKNIEILEAILSDKNEEQVFYREFAMNQKNLKSSNFQNKKLFEEIKSNLKKNNTIQLDDLFLEEKQKPSILKIDVHGAEGKVIKGGKNFLKESVNIILLELHSQNYLNIYSDGIKRKEVIVELNTIGFKTFMISPFREIDRKKHDNEFLSYQKKLNFKEINYSNADELFFGNNDDTFILCLNESCSIEEFSCFN